MKFVIVDDDRNICRILRQIITERNLGVVEDYFTDPVEALDDLKLLNPDFVLVDLLMPEIDGITFVKKAREILPDVMCIMISQVDSIDMISDAYNAGIEFFIRKPINSIETEAVITNLSKMASMQKTLKKMQNLVMGQGEYVKAPVVAKSEGAYSDVMNTILQSIGISGEVGSSDICTVVNYLAENDLQIGDLNVRTLCERFTDAPIGMEQRIRRTIAKGLTCLAYMGLEDYTNENFNRYAHTLYSYEQIRFEMEYLKGRRSDGGKVRIKNFLNAAVIQCKELSEN